MSDQVSLPIVDWVPEQRPGSGHRSGWNDPADWHVIRDGRRTHLFVVDGSRVYSIDEATAERLEEAGNSDGHAGAVLADVGVPVFGAACDHRPAAPPLRSLSLAVSQKCNLGCTYCYAEGGSFGGQAKNMPVDVALASVDRLLAHVAAGERANLAFLGGEPLVNRSAVRAATEYAQRKAEEQAASIGFSITTNGTMLTDEDGDFFERHGFAVTVSLDGVGKTHDAQRAFKSGRGSYEQIIQRVRPLLSMQRKMQVSARVTVTPRNLCLRETLDELIGLGFHSVGFSPMLSSPAGRDEMGRDELRNMLDKMIDCGREFERQVIEGGRYPFSNMTNAMQEIHKGTHRPYPCGAGAGYFGVSADGELFACHRFVDDEVGAMGDLVDGVDPRRQERWLAERHVHTQEPCRSCWARYLCGGGCHHEVIKRGRPACDYIRGWLHYCLQAYVRLLEQRPDYFGV